MLAEICSCSDFYAFIQQVKRSRSKGGLAGPDGTKSVFGQMCAKMSSFSPDSLLLPHRVWKVKFVGKRIPSLSPIYPNCFALIFTVFFWFNFLEDLKKGRSTVKQCLCIGSIACYFLTYKTLGNTKTLKNDFINKQKPKQQQKNTPKMNGNSPVIVLVLQRQLSYF